MTEPTEQQLPLLQVPSDWFPTSEDETGWTASQLVQMLRATEEEAGAAPAAAAAAPAAAAGVAPAAGSSSPMYHAQADDWEATYLDVPEVPRRMFSTRVYRRTTRSANPALDLHAPTTRSLFLELKNKLKDLDAIYHQYEGETDGSSSFVPTTKHLEMHKSLTESLNFFKKAITENFENFAEQEEICQKESRLLADATKMLTQFDEPSFDAIEFHDCAANVVTALTTLCEDLNCKTTEAVKRRNFFWKQFCGLRDLVKHVQNVHSDLICQLCYQAETQVVFDCGHMACVNCSSRVSSCPSCRNVITKKIKLFL